jgi:hypothetical protein
MHLTNLYIQLSNNIRNISLYFIFLPDFLQMKILLGFWNNVLEFIRSILWSTT